MRDIIDTIAEAMFRDQAAVQEKALEAAVQTGLYGASTIHHGLRCTSRVDRNVPYGEHFIFPSHDSYEAWLQRGAPTS